MTYKYIFQVTVRPGKDAEFIKHWRGGSVPLQKCPGALGTRLHKKRGQKRVYIAIAEWTSKEARLKALESVEDPTNPLFAEYAKWKSNEEFGKVRRIAEVDQVADVVLVN